MISLQMLCTRIKRINPEPACIYMHTKKGTEVYSKHNKQRATFACLRTSSCFSLLNKKGVNFEASFQNGNKKES